MLRRSFYMLQASLNSPQGKDVAWAHHTLPICTGSIFLYSLSVLVVLGPPIGPHISSAVTYPACELRATGTTQYSSRGMCCAHIPRLDFQSVIQSDMTQRHSKRHSKVMMHLPKLPSCMSISFVHRLQHRPASLRPTQERCLPRCSATLGCWLPPGVSTFPRLNLTCLMKLWIRVSETKLLASMV